MSLTVASSRPSKEEQQNCLRNHWTMLSSLFVITLICGCSSVTSGTSRTTSPALVLTSGSTVSLSSLTANNTAACPASGTLPVQCTAVFAGQSDTRADVDTAEFDPPAGNVSDEDIHGYLNEGSGTKIFANFMTGYCVLAGNTYCNGNVQPGYTSNSTNTVAAQAQDLIRRHIDGAIMSWAGDGTVNDATARKFQSYVNSNYCTGPQECDVMYMLMYNAGAAWQYTVTSTGVPGTSGTACTNETGSTFENCVIEHFRNDICYNNGYHWGNNAYQKIGGHPVFQIFQDETVIPATGAAPSWEDVWVHLADWSSNLSTNCATAPYNSHNGVPLFVFVTKSGFTHEASSGAFYWVTPAGTDPTSDQSIYNISPSSTNGTLDNFFAAASSYPSLETWGAGFKGFNSSQANWGANRIMDQACGQTWISSLTEGNKYYTSTALPFLKIVTWNDYNEGTEIEAGIDNCYTVSASVSGTSLHWTLNTTNPSEASLTTVSHIEVYDSTDGVNLTLLGTQSAAASGTYSLSGLASGSHSLFVRMVGKNSILNRLSPSIAYSN